MVRNEADIIESFVRHNVAFLDELHIIVQPSGDGTDWILGKLAEEGLPLVVIENNDAGFMQGEHLSSHARRLLATAQCDAVVVLDADEFIKAPDRTSLVNAISAIPAGLFGCWEWHSYVPTVEPTPSGEPITRIITHRRRREPPVRKMILTRRFAERSDLRLNMGSHTVTGSAGPDTRKVARLRNLALGHFPVRSAGQISEKINRGVAVLDKDFSGTHLGYHWRRIRQMIAAEGLSFDLLQKIAYDYQFADLEPVTDIAAALIHDPIPCDFSLRYPPP